jgi:hypothetical protein
VLTFVLQFGSMILRFFKGFIILFLFLFHNHTGNNTVNSDNPRLLFTAQEQGCYPVRQVPSHGFALLIFRFNCELGKNKYHFTSKCSQGNRLINYCKSSTFEYKNNDKTHRFVSKKMQLDKEFFYSLPLRSPPLSC